MPWSHGYGLSEVYISSDGTWTITRREYVDRKQRYTITARGELITQAQSERPYSGEDVSGTFNENWVGVKDGTTLRVTSRRKSAYWEWLSAMQRERLEDYENPLPALDQVRDEPALSSQAAPDHDDQKAAAQVTDSEDKPGSDSLEDAAVPVLDSPDTSSLTAPTTSQETRLAKQATREMLDNHYTAVSVVFNMRNQLIDIEILRDHWFFHVYDAACFVDPYLYLTTDRQRVLHRCLIDQSEQLPRVERIHSVVLAPWPRQPDRRCRLVHDPLRGLCILQPDGTRHWFDSETLQQLGSDKLPGNWEPEYASFDLRPGYHNAFLGHALTKAQYERCMRGILLTFLACLLGLVSIWRPPKSSIGQQTSLPENAYDD
jgi:hypothetical protein